MTHLCSNNSFHGAIEMATNSRVTLGKSLPLFEPQKPHLSNKGKNNGLTVLESHCIL